MFSGWKERRREDKSNRENSKAKLYNSLPFVLESLVNIFTKYRGWIFLEQPLQQKGENEL